MSSRSALLWLTHVWTSELQAEFEKLYSLQVPESPETWLLIDARTSGVKKIVRSYPRHYIFDEETLFALPYPKLSGYGLINHPHFPVLDFYLTHQNYDAYWVIEYDVRFTGRWESLFNAFRGFDHDLVTSHIRSFPQEPHWYWWDSLHHPSKSIARESYLRSFNVVYRISNRALKFIHHAQADGWQGHPEVSLPTLLFDAGFKLLDFGGKGAFVPPKFENRFYSSHDMKSGNLCFFGSMRYRPSRPMPGTKGNTLYHPVKPGPVREPLKARLSIIDRWILDLIRDMVSFS